MKKLLTIAFLTAFFSVSFGQVVINSADMPVPGDTLRYKTATTVNGIDYTLTGNNYIWDFSTLSSTTENADTFVSVLSTALTYNIAFSNPLDPTHLATVASPQPASMPVPIIQLSNVYDFFKKSTSAYSMVGLGASINGIPLPVKYDNPEVYYHFPITLGANDSTTSSFGVILPSIGYYGETRKRVNLVDGWGVLYLPFDTFNVIRIESNIFVHDTVHLDTLGGHSFAFNHTENEYRWLAQNHHLPVLLINKRNGMGGTLTIKYSDYVDTASYVSENTFQNGLIIYPNPTTGKIQIESSNLKVQSLDIYDMKGQLVKQFPNLQSQIPNEIDVSSFPNGLYLFQFRTGKNIYNRKILIQ